MSIKVELISHTPDPELTVAAAARTCIRDDDHWRIRDDLSTREVHRLIATVIAKGHHSVLEHVSFTFAISGVSRVLSHQLVRHRIASYSQLSQQRSDASYLSYVVPPEIRKDPELLREYEKTMGKCQVFYRRLLERSVPMGSARYVLPSAFTTRLLMSMNARSLFNLISQRECAAEEWEFRQVATLIHRRLMAVAPDIFRFAGTDCETHGVCAEGEIGLTCERRTRTGVVVTNTRRELLEKVPQ